MLNLSTNWILNWGPSREASSCQSCPPPLFRTSCLIMRCGGVYQAYSNYPAFAEITDCKCKISETIQRGRTEMLQVEIVFFSPLIKRIHLQCNNKESKIGKVAYQYSWSQGVHWFSMHANARTLFWFSYMQISAGLICYSSVRNWGKYIKPLGWCLITWGAPPPTLHCVLSMHIVRIADLYSVCYKPHLLLLCHRHSWLFPLKKLEMMPPVF